METDFAEFEETEVPDPTPQGLREEDEDDDGQDDTLDDHLPPPTATEIEEPATQNEAILVAWALEKKPEEILPSELARVESLQPACQRIFWNCDLTEVGAATRFLAHFGDYLRYVSAKRGGKWMVFDPTGGGWVESPQAVGRLLIRTISTLVAHAYERFAEGERKAWMTHLCAMAKARSMESILKIAQLGEVVVWLDSRPARMVAVDSEKMDSNGWLLGCRNGVLDLRTEEFRPYSREDLISRRADVDYDPAAVSRHLPALVGEHRYDSGQHDTLQEFLGSTLVGELHDRKALFLLGENGTGKTTLIKGWGKVLGSYSMAATMQLYTVDKHGKPPTLELAAMQGCRFVFAPEADENTWIDEARLKLLTGGDYSPGRGHYEQFSYSEATAHHTIYGNNTPRIRSRDAAFWERVLLISAKGQTTEDNQERTIRDEFWKSDQERSGFLNWALAGLRRWKNQGMKIKVQETVKQHVADYNLEEDELGDFLADHCELGKGKEFWVSRDSVLDAHTRWCKASNEKPWTQNRLYKALRARKFKEGKKDCVRGFWGLRLAQASGPE